VPAGGDQRARDDRPRLLAARSELGYTDRIDRALHEEPEAVSSRDQQRITLDAQRRDRADRVVAWKAAHVTITTAIATFSSSCRIDKRLSSTLRLIERQCAQLDRDVTR
jgi:hypothetical protein